MATLVLQSSGAMGASVSTRALAAFEDALGGEGERREALVMSGKELLEIPSAALERALHLRELCITDARLSKLPASFGCLVQLECEACPRTEKA